MTDHPVRPSPPTVPVEVPLEGRDPDLVADELFVLGASAVLEREGSVVADLPVEVLGRLGAHRVLEEPAPVDPEVTSRPVGRRLRLTPAGSVPQNRGISAQTAGQNGGGGDRVEVVLEAGGAFGSGSHPSTRLCLAALEPLAPQADTVLDVGCGTGVLGAAALLLGAGSLTAVDVDPEARRVTRSVLDRNGLADRAEVSDQPLARVEGTFDLVLANLLIPVVESLGAELAARVAPGGALVVGGILLHQRERAIRSLAPLVPRVAHVEHAWWAAVLSDPATAVSCMNVL